ncbi:DUF2058 family protein [Dokdonella sp.]|uniref:DUF2058 family protein n=1 Tax=Dokdonella sp. TaxID=2291710 RepID=UPI001B1D52A6|nr:DUF2058 family protein [Dokdonella sp.]MBO9662446.1 DUF2058 family protein [Dokdonella sp.]
MSESLRDQLLKAGFVAKPQSKPQPQKRPQQAQRPQQRPQQQQRGQQQQRPPRRESGEIDLAKAYALRDRNDRDERERAQREAEQRAREKKERKQKLAALLNGKGLNQATAEIPRHFPHANKIRRIYVTAEQLPRLNGGELAVTQFAGRYLLVTREIGLAAQTIDPEALVLLCDSQAIDDDGVPADLVW